MQPRHDSGRQQTGTSTQACRPRNGHEGSSKETGGAARGLGAGMALFKEDLTCKDFTNTRWLDAYGDTAAAVQEVGGKMRVLSVCDREANVHEPFDAQRKSPRRIAGPREAWPAPVRSRRPPHQIARPDSPSKKNLRCPVFSDTACPGSRVQSASSLAMSCCSPTETVTSVASPVISMAKTVP